MIDKLPSLQNNRYSSAKQPKSASIYSSSKSSSGSSNGSSISKNNNSKLIKSTMLTQSLSSSDTEKVILIK